MTSASNLVDVLDYPLPHLDEPLPASAGQYAGEHTRRWSETIDRFDGYVFVTPEYNHSTSGALKNAIETTCTASGTTWPPGSWGTALSARLARSSICA
ncbi:NADPH-dependent FMN reductase [Kribbella sp. NPDC004875]|uniref:NADPH-dependent FMN reductase n=1 Tax=Kribbella sp. NPDC004875 TaxID=3364107 RepID=UPI003674F93A